jgi:allantoin racemase
VVDIPVVAPLRAVLHVAAQVGEQFGVVCYHPSAIPRHWAQTRAYGMESFIAGRRASVYLQHIAANRDEMVESFLKTARTLIADDGADVIIPQGITQCPLTMKPWWLAGELGVPVVEGIGAPIKMAAMLWRWACGKAGCAGRRKARSSGEAEAGTISIRLEGVETVCKMGGRARVDDRACR